MKRGGALDSRVSKSYQQVAEDTINEEANRFASVTSTISDLQAMLNSRARTKGEVVRAAVDRIEEYVWMAPEFQIPRNVPEIRIGLMGPSASSREGILQAFGGSDSISLNRHKGQRFKRPTVVGDNTYLVLMREEVGAPPEDFARWVDVLVVICDARPKMKLAEDYLKLFRRTRELDTVSIVLAYVKPTGKNPKKSDFKDKFFELNETGKFTNCEVNLDNTSSVTNVVKVACAAHIEKVTDIAPTLLSSTPGIFKNGSRPLIDESPIIMTPMESTHSQVKVDDREPDVTLGTAHLFTPAPEYDDFLTPAPRRDCSVAVSGSSRQLRSRVQRKEVEKQPASEKLSKMSKRKVQFNTPPRNEERRVQFQTPASAMSPHITITISPDSPLAFTPSIKSPYVSILLDSE